MLLIIIRDRKLESIHAFQCFVQVSTKFSFYIQRDGRYVALKCKKRAKRSVGLIKCTQGSWEFAADICDSDCALDDVKIDNGVKVVYDENEYVFQCLPNYELIGAAVAHCPEYTPNAVYNTSVSFVSRRYHRGDIVHFQSFIGDENATISLSSFFSGDHFLILVECKTMILSSVVMIGSETEISSEEMGSDR